MEFLKQRRLSMRTKVSLHENKSVSLLKAKSQTTEIIKKNFILAFAKASLKQASPVITKHLI